MTALAIERVRKRLGEREILKGLSLEVASGEFFCLLGASGCGKSTLLRLIAGLERPDSGHIRLAGQPIDALDPAARDVAMVFQSYALYPHMTVAENLALPLLMRQMSWSERFPLLGRLSAASRAKRRHIDAEVARTAQTLGISALLGRKPGQLSGGQRQRVAIGRAIIRSPQLFLMDEPLSNLDSGLRAELRREIVALRGRLSATFIYVTHDHTEAMTMADRIGVMADGELLQVGTPAEIYGDPCDIRVARALGAPSINLLPARIAARGIETGGAYCPIKTGMTPGARVVLGVRPEHLALAAGPGDLALTGRVRWVEDNGADLHVQLRLAGSDADLVMRIPWGEGRRWATEDLVTVYAPRTAIRVFDETGRRVEREVCP